MVPLVPDRVGCRRGAPLTYPALVPLRESPWRLGKFLMLRFRTCESPTGEGRADAHPEGGRDAAGSLDHVLPYVRLHRLHLGIRKRLRL